MAEEDLAFERKSFAETKAVAEEDLAATMSPGQFLKEAHTSNRPGVGREFINEPRAVPQGSPCTGANGSVPFFNQ